MKVLAAYLLAVLGGNKSPSAEDINAILGAVEITADSEEVAKVVSELQGKDVHDVIEQGKQKLSAVPSVGVGVSGGAAAHAGGSAAAASAPAASAAAQKKSFCFLFGFTGEFAARHNILNS
jgi:large subunit ribosomal protein LP2